MVFVGCHCRQRQWQRLACIGLHWSSLAIVGQRGCPLLACVACCGLGVTSFLLTCFCLMSDRTASSCLTSFFPHVDTHLILAVYLFLPRLLHTLTMLYPYVYHESIIYINRSLVSCTLVYSLFDTQSKEPTEDFWASEALLSLSTYWNLELLN